MAVEYKQYLRPASIPGRKIFCCLCSEDGVWDGTCLEKFAARFPDAKERYLEKPMNSSYISDMFCTVKERTKTL